MIYSLIVFIFSFIFLYSINIFQIKQNFLIDVASKNEKHKFLLNQRNKKVPLSGFLYFLPVIFLLNIENYISVSIACAFLFFVGFLSDSKLVNSPKIRLFAQLSILILFLFYNNDLNIDFRIEYLNLILKSEVSRVLIISFFFLVLINGFNFIDGVNNLCVLNFLIILIFIKLLSNKLNIQVQIYQIDILIILLTVFTIFNFFGKNYLGDAAVYGLSFFVGFVAINYSLQDQSISPYFIANLLWYPAFENLFCIIRRYFEKKKNYLPDNNHLHQLLFKYLLSLKLIKKKYVLSSMSGILINLYLSIIFLVGLHNHSETKLQVFLITINIFVYLFFYFILKKIND